MEALRSDSGRIASRQADALSAPREGVLAGRSVVVTGATRGFGFAMARAFLAAGARVMICGRSPAAVQSAVDELANASDAAQVDGAACDVGDLEQVRDLATRALELFGDIDVWVNNAAISGPYGEVESIPRDRFVEVIDTNILGVYHGTVVALERMLPRRAGKIINIAGLGADGRKAPFQVPYASSKAWVQSFTVSVAAEHKDSGVGVFVLNPGLMVTDLTTFCEATSDSGCDRLEALPRVLETIGQSPEVPARRAVWLASSATDGKTGLVVREFTGPRIAWLAARRLVGRLFGRGQGRPDVKVERLG